MSRVLRIINMLVIMTISIAAHAQASGDRPWQGEVFLGRALPHGISAADDIFTVWGVNLGIPMGGEKSSGGFFDAGYISGRGGNTKWDGISAGVSLQIPIETLIAHAGIGIDMTRYSSDTQTSAKEVFGEHFLGGVLIRLAPAFLTRFDLKFNTAPGTTVMFALGFVLEI